MFPSSAMQTVRRGSTASNDGENVKEEGVRFNHGSQKHVPRTALSPLRSALKSKSPQRLTYKSEPVRQLHDAVPEVERCLTSEFNPDNRGYQSRRPLSVVNRHGGDVHNDYRATFENSDDRRRPIDGYGLGQRQARDTSPHQRSEQADFNYEVSELQRREGKRYGSDHRSLGTQRPSSTGTFNERFSSSDSYEQEYYGNNQFGRVFRDSTMPSSRRSRAEDQSSSRMHEDQFSQEKVMKKSLFRNEVSTDEQGSLYHNKSLRRKSHSVGRYELEDGSGINTFEEAHHETYVSGSPRSNDRYSQPSFERKNRYCEVSRTDDTDGAWCGPFDRTSQTFDQYGFDRSGQEYFGVGQLRFD